MSDFWKLYQNDLGCAECVHLIPEMRGAGQPCQFFGDLNDIDECSHRLVAPRPSIEAEMVRIPVD